jgi:hypothetical protein
MEKYTLKKLDEKEKEKIIFNFCKHLKDGYSEYSFVECDYKNVGKYAIELDKRNNKESQVEKIQRAMRESFYFWEKLALDMVKDESKKYFFPVWIFYVKSRFHWGEKNKKKSLPRNKIVEIDLSLDNDIKEINA